MGKSDLNPLSAAAGRCPGGLKISGCGEHYAFAVLEHVASVQQPVNPRGGSARRSPAVA
jgi:hypothetical protein